MKNKGHETWLRRWFLRLAGVAAAVMLGMAILVSAAFAAQKSRVPIAHCWSVYENAKKDIIRIFKEVHTTRAVRMNGHVVNRFANRTTLTWTRTDTDPGGLTCIRDGGTDYDGPFPEKAP